MEDLAQNMRECIGQEVWATGGDTLWVDGESLVLRARPSTAAEVRRVLAEMRR